MPFLFEWIATSCMNWHLKCHELKTSFHELSYGHCCLELCVYLRVYLWGIFTNIPLNYIHTLSFSPFINSPIHNSRKHSNISKPQCAKAQFMMITSIHGAEREFTEKPSSGRKVSLRGKDERRMRKRKLLPSRLRLSTSLKDGGFSWPQWHFVSIHDAEHQFTERSENSCP